MICKWVAPVLCAWFIGIAPMTGEAKKVTLKLKTQSAKSGRKSSGANGTSKRIEPLEADSLQFALWKDSVSFSGFDKPAASRRETFLVTNATPQHLKGVEVRLIYRDPEGRMLHSRDQEIRLDIPPGETRQADIRSFDTQQTFYYHRSQPPKRRSAQPFSVEITLLRLLLPR